MQTCEDVAKKIWNWSNGLSLDQVLRKSGILPRTARKEHGTMLRKICYWDLQKSGHPIFRATTPLSRGQLKSKGKGKVSIHFSADTDTIDTIYRIILSVNQLSIYGAVAAICDEYEGHPDNTGEPRSIGGSINCSQRSQSWSTCSWRTWRLQNHFAEIFSAS